MDAGIEPVSFATMTALAAHGPDTFVGTWPRYPWGGLYGGQIVAQALRAASLTVADSVVPHSLHAYFIRRGDAAEPIRFEVERLRDGRSFSTRAVVARQSTGAILNLSASFHDPEDAPDVQAAVLPAGVAEPEGLSGDRWSHLFERRWPDTRHSTAPGRLRSWLRLDEPVPADPHLQACALAYLSDDLPTEAVVALHPDCRDITEDGEFDRRFMSASLDHAMWFHRPVDANAWHLHDLTCRALTDNRGLATGELFAPDGSHVASVAQEVLLRRVADGA